MNKLASFLIFFAFGVLGGLTGCEGSPEPRTGLLFAAGNNLITGDQAVAGSQVYSTSLFAQTGSGNAFTRFKIIRTYDKKDSITYLDSTINQPEFGLYLTFGTRGQAGEETWRFVITDQNNTEYSRRFTLTTSSTNNTTRPFNAYTSYFYKRNALENLQYFSLRNGTVYPGFIGRTNPEVKPMVDFYFEEDAAKIISVNAVTAAGTKFKPTTLTPAAFNETATLSDLKNGYATNNNDPVNTVQNLSKNQVISFNTSTRSGLIRINSINKVFDLEKNDSILVRMTYDVKSER